MEHKIIGVLPGSVGEEIGIRPGDTLVAINEAPVEDLLDYQYYDSLEELSVTVREAATGEYVQFDVEKYEDEHLGLCFENDLLTLRKCCNKCMFCFIDQLPPNMRSSLYVKDDDWRLSVLMGNYVTLTNMTPSDLKRIIDRHISPLYISVHAVEPELRKQILGNKSERAGSIMETLTVLRDAGIRFHTQVVLCPDINDGSHLRETFEKLYTLYPACMSLAVVPVGLTYHRKNLPKLQAFLPAQARHVVENIEKWQESCLAMGGSRFVFASDELYLKAGLPIPEYEAYEDFPQIENGVGLLAKFRHELNEELHSMPPWIPDRKVAVATGVSAAPFLREMCAILKEKYPNLNVLIYPIRNFFFGESITVSGLLTGRDMAVQLDGKDLGSEVVISATTLRDGETVFLDNLTVQNLSDWIHHKVTTVENSGAAFARAITGTEEIRL